MSYPFRQEHVRRYQETDGEDGYIWKEVSTTTPLIFGLEGDNAVVVASRAPSA